MAELRQVKTYEIMVGDHDVRGGQDDEALAALSQSVRRVGVLSPLVCRDVDNGLQLIAGHRRLLAAKAAGLETVPVFVREATDKEAAEVGLAENLFREDLTPVETAAALKDTLDRETMGVEELAAACHRSVEWVRRMVGMLSWPIDVLGAVDAGWLSVSAAANLAIIPDDDYRAFLVRTAYESGATARTTAAWLQAWRAMEPAAEAVRAEPAPVGAPAEPKVAQAPCFCCGDTFRQDELSYLALCMPCIRAVRDAGGQVAGGDRR